MKEYFIRFKANNMRAEGLLDKALSGVESNMHKVCKRIGLRPEDYILEVKI